METLIYAAVTLSIITGVWWWMDYHYKKGATPEEREDTVRQVRQGFYWTLVLLGGL